MRDLFHCRSTGHAGERVLVFLHTSIGENSEIGPDNKVFVYFTSHAHVPGRVCDVFGERKRMEGEDSGQVRGWSATRSSIIDSGPPLPYLTAEPQEMRFGSRPVHMVSVHRCRGETS